jgi:hypothetical protein
MKGWDFADVVIHESFFYSPDEKKLRDPCRTPCVFVPFPPTVAISQPIWRAND